MVTRERLHQLIDTLPDDELDAAARLLEDLQAPRRWPLPAFPTGKPEALTPEEERELQETLGELARGELIPHEEIRREFGRP